MPHDASRTPQAEPPPIDDALVDAIAREVDCDPRSVIRAVAGLRVAGPPGRRIAAALARRGLAVPTDHLQARTG